MTTLNEQDERFEANGDDRETAEKAISRYRQVHIEIRKKRATMKQPSKPEKVIPAVKPTA